MRRFMRILALVSAGIFCSFWISCSKENKEDFHEEGGEQGDDSMVLGKSTTLLSDEQIAHLVAAEDGGLVFDESIDEADLPKVGQILLCMEPVDLASKSAGTSSLGKKLNSFLGRVKEVIKGPGNYKIQTEAVPLDEAFERLSVNETVDLVLSKSGPDTRVDVSVDEDGFVCFNQEISKEIDEYSVSGNAMLGFKLTIVIDIDNQIHKPYASVVLQSKIAGGIHFSFFKEGEFESIKIPIGPAIPLTASLSNIIIGPYLQLYGVVEFSGDIFVGGDLSFSKQLVSGFEYKDGAWKVGTHSQGEKNKKDNSGIDASAKISLNGSVFAGLSTAVELRFFNNKDMALSLEPKLGLNETGNFVFDTSEPTPYERLKEAKVKAELMAKVDAKVSANIFRIDAEINIPVVEIPFWEKEAYLLPDFQQLVCQVDAVTQKVHVKTDVSRDLLFGGQLGFSLYRGEQWKQNSTPEVEYWLTEDFKNPLEYDFYGLESGGDYQVYPYIKLAGHEFLATPGDFSLLKVVTRDSYAERGNSVTCYGEVKGLKAGAVNVNAGICYSEENPLPDIRDKHAEKPVFADGPFEMEVDNLKKNKMYYYRVFVEENGSYYYGEVRQFILDEGIITKIEFRDDRRFKYYLYDYDAEGRLVRIEENSGDDRYIYTVVYAGDRINVTDNTGDYSLIMDFQEGKLVKTQMKGRGLLLESVMTYTPEGWISTSNYKDYEWKDDKKDHCEVRKEIHTVYTIEDGNISYVEEDEYTWDGKRWKRTSTITPSEVLNKANLNLWGLPLEDTAMEGLFMGKEAIGLRNLPAKVVMTGDEFHTITYTYETNEKGYVTKIIETVQYIDGGNWKGVYYITYK